MKLTLTLSLQSWMIVPASVTFVAIVAALLDWLENTGLGGLILTVWTVVFGLTMLTGMMAMDGMA